MKKKQILGLLVFSLLLISLISVFAGDINKTKIYDKENEKITIANSNIQNILVSSNETHIFLSNDYQNISMEYINFFIPKELQDNLRYVTPCDEPNGFYCQGDYYDPIYNENKLFHIKTDPNAGNQRFYALVDYLFDYENMGIDISKAINFEIYSANQGNVITYSVGDIVIYDSKYYQCKQAIFNYNGIPPSLNQYWEEVQPGERTEVPTGFGYKRINYEISMNYREDNQNQAILYNFSNSNDINISVYAQGYDIIINWTYLKEGQITASYSKTFKGADAEYQLIDNSCDEQKRFCQAIIKTNLKEEGKLLDEINFLINKVRWYKIYLNTTGEKINKSYYNETSNETEYNLIDAPDWSLYENQETIGEKIWKIEAEKRPSWMVDWVIDKFGISLTEWAIWGNISTGDDAEVILNSPADNSVSPTNNVFYSASGNITGGATIVNMTLFTDESGSWEGYNFSEMTSGDFSLGVPLGETQTLGTLRGEAITIKEEDIYLYSVTKSSTANIPSVNVQWSNLTGEVFTANFSGNTAVFEPPIKLSANVLYGIYYSGAMTFSKNTSRTTSYPIETELFNWTGSQGYGTLDYEYFYLFESLNVGTIPNLDVYRTITNDTNFNFKYCDSDGVCAFAEENRTVLLNRPPQFEDIFSPSILLTSATFDLRLNISDDLDNLSSCSFNITRGASTEVANTDLNVSQYPLINYTNIPLSSEASYVLNLFCNDSIGNINTTNLSFTYAIPVIPPAPPGGGGGSTTTIGLVDANYSITTLTGGKEINVLIAKDSTKPRKKKFLLQNSALEPVTVTIGCSTDNVSKSNQDVNICDYITFDKTSYTIPANSQQDIIGNFYTGSVPNSKNGDIYYFNIVATTNKDFSALSVSAKVSWIAKIYASSYYPFQKGVDNKASFSVFFVSFIFSIIITIVSIVIFRKIKLPATGFFAIILILLPGSFLLFMSIL